MLLSYLKPLDCIVRWNRIFSILALCAILFSMTHINAASYVPIKDREGNGLAMTSSPYANAVGKAVLDSGGNAIDAAVAVSYALAVTHPAAGNIGGGGFALIHLANGEDIALDFREVAPKAASRDMFLDSKGEVIPNAAVTGYLSVGVPGSVKGMSAMLDKYGTKTLSELLEPSVMLAEKGFMVTQRQQETMQEVQSDFAKFESSSKYFLKENGEAYKDGDILIQKDLARTLRILQKEGGKAFYEGEIAKAMVSDIQKGGGILTLQDLKDYKVKWRKPLRGTYRGYDIITMPPPSSGGAHILEILNIIENADMAKLGFASSKSIHLLTEAMRQAQADRSSFMGDPDFIDLPLDTLLSKEYAREVYRSIKTNRATPSDRIIPGLGKIKQNNNPNLHEGSNTTHFSVVDKWGNAVSVTYTLNRRYGSGVAVSDYGFLLNDQMENFSIKVGYPNRHGMIEGTNNAIAPNKRPLSTMSPTMILKDGKLYVVLGSPGSGKIISVVAQVIVNLIDYKMDLVTAVESPRFHMQWQPDTLDIEKFSINKDTQEILKRMGYKVIETDTMGDVNAILIDPKTGIIYGTLDPRRKI
ncbi:gamma-glutamyltransferase [Helicobacter bilis]|uniref:gamma-glutamyltransferase n=1 Tax=Helicobacter bilis TaxID=37372 RepID=UPI00051D51E9|nr:gamma-glutamyltransferase [Helicobacter bilis]MCI7412091.1 gamma-glutamyltransferase [Helicobacter bilis]MDD7297765.1 gamma-glutamyltransferase [Helicobacter bilis]MDY4399300.1 gamma-glutamyltransferase [Helicobacter bilis]TLE09766.1 gamma-glutamyltransferase [Helicobacter bilis]